MQRAMITHTPSCSWRRCARWGRARPPPCQRHAVALTAVEHGAHTAAAAGAAAPAAAGAHGGHAGCVFIVTRDPSHPPASHQVTLPSSPHRPPVSLPQTPIGRGGHPMGDPPGLTGGRCWTSCSPAGRCASASKQTAQQQAQGRPGGSRWTQAGPDEPRRALAGPAGSRGPSESSQPQRMSEPPPPPPTPRAACL
jgi:hypothetical protein